MLDKLKYILKYCNEKGVLLPFVRDPIKQAPSVSLTLLIISFGVAVVTNILNLTKQLDDVGYVMELFYACSCLYFGRSFTGKSGSQINESGQSTPAQPPTPPEITNIQITTGNKPPA